MGLWMIILIVSLGAPGIGVFWWTGKMRDRARKMAVDGDQYDAKEMLIAFGATKEWV